MSEKISGVMRGALEHEVFEEVGKTALVTLFILGTHVVPKIYGDNRQLWLVPEYDIDAVAERRF
jgi:hypothetical protein